MFQTKLDPAGGVWSWGQASTLAKIAVVADFLNPWDATQSVQAVCYSMLQHDYDYVEIYIYIIYHMYIYIIIYIYIHSIYIYPLVNIQKAIENSHRHS